MPEDGGWGSARGPAKHFQACYYFILGSHTLTSNANPLTRLMHLACSDSFWLLHWIDVASPPVAAELWSCLNVIRHQSKCQLDHGILSEGGCRRWVVSVSSVHSWLLEAVVTHTACQRTMLRAGVHISENWSWLGPGPDSHILRLPVATKSGKAVYSFPENHHA